MKRYSFKVMSRIKKTKLPECRTASAGFLRDSAQVWPIEANPRAEGWIGPGAGPEMAGSLYSFGDSVGVEFRSPVLSVPLSSLTHTL